ncbi:uncharacterized protein J8A68_002560 [[Candida] subhashii]|uniref:CS domain-containing protein n=1 Tax=[Candida] subhashii TaxID=561895 RepID=A0A8J5UIV8_9ASCO|nr:uncharacterized protein J8A68_002560 [[Candida] subhashii]KAG7663933.1 hypothetical protein J8A68_002560 [[Candida] subhashii]
MITPFFTIDQDDEFIYVSIKISHIRFSAPNIEMIVDNELFIFSLPPYYLRIRLPHPCIDDDRSHAEFDSKSESVKVKIPKETKGQHFPDLDLTSKLLARTNELQPPPAQQEQAPRPLIEELDVDNTQTQAEKDLTEGEAFNWEIKQDAVVQEEAITIEGNKYGFNNQYDKIVGISVSNGNDINELGDPENTAEDDRIIERLIKENIKFDPEIYAADYIMEKYPNPNEDDKYFKQLMEWKNPFTQKFLKWYKQQQQTPESERSAIMPVEFTKEEQEKMMNLPRKTYLIEDNNTKMEILVLMICLLFAFHFDLRENEGEHHIESAWTIGKIVPQFSCLDSRIIVSGTNSNYLQSAVITSIRRALSYPFHRNLKMIEKVWDDVYYNLRGGKRLILQALLDLKELFRFHDVYYVYDKIWLEDLCAYLISDNISEATIRSLAHDLKKEYTSIKKSNITFEKIDSEKIVVNDDKDDDETMKGEDEEDDEMIVLSLEEIELMAEESFEAFQQHLG